VITVLTYSVFDGIKEMVSQYRDKQVGIDPVFLLREIGAPAQGGVESAAGRLDPGEHDVSLPNLLIGEVLAVGAQHLTAIELTLFRIGGAFFPNAILGRGELIFGTL
jgi:hypothetical protein